MLCISPPPSQFPLSGFTFHWSKRMHSRVVSKTMHCVYLNKMWTRLLFLFRHVPIRSPALENLSSASLSSLRRFSSLMVYKLPVEDVQPLSQAFFKLETGKWMGRDETLKSRKKPKQQFLKMHNKLWYYMQNKSPRLPAGRDLAISGDAFGSYE